MWSQLINFCQVADRIGPYLCNDPFHWFHVKVSTGLVPLIKVEKPVQMHADGN